ncbi:MAG: HesB/YadR/YfhF-family protein [Saccharopolyspora sp.]|uniref:HesB/YadR/YfhF-family protein n=1 Tax=Saccharopolyspora TaxID=1835 RepID=UPI00190DD31E|nr:MULTISPECIES: HesB/YadR/YfhF-family protein [unclassified Saccharopolyspora]MBK0868047.1 HesB/YadR/YfhF-family protein [Saccharopolyspora sp. HNM0986]MBQ6641001.1 HesB/YadR/YfhF-family protein [Saccharopolyspora sp.]
MLTISESAAEVIKVVLAGGESGESSGLRIAPVANASGEGELQAAIASEPQADDEVVEESGARVFLEPQAASLLGDKVLDAERDDNGELSLAVRE